MKLGIFALMIITAAGLHARIHAVASNAIIADWLQQVGGEEVEVIALAGAGSDPHHYSPSPRDIGRISRADIVVAFSSDMEPWVADLIDDGSHVLYLNDGLDLMAVGEPFWLERKTLYPDPDSKPPCCREDAHAANRSWTAMIKRMPVIECDSHDHSHHDHHGHDHGASDPHAWLDPQLALLMVLEINDALNERSPAQEAYFDQRRKAYLDQLIEMDEWAQAQIDEVPVERRVLVTYHDNVRYLARRYGLFTPASILGSVSTETADPSAKQFTKLLRLIKDLDAPAVFVDATANPRLAQQAAREAGLPAPVALYTDNLTGPDGPAPNYLSLMRYNVSAIANALQ